MTKEEKIQTLAAIRKDAQERMETAVNGGSVQYYKGMVDALDKAIAVTKNNEYGNDLKEVYLGKEVNE